MAFLHGAGKSPKILVVSRHHNPGCIQSNLYTYIVYSAMKETDVMANTSLNLTRPNNQNGSVATLDRLPPLESAQYVADMVLELRNIAKSCNFKVLQGLLEITYYEAFTAAHPPVIPTGEMERLHEMGEDARLAEST
jgi:hypothetical protein